MPKQKKVHSPIKIVPTCAACLAPAEQVGVSGQTGVGKAETLTGFVVCCLCYDKMRNAHLETAKQTVHKKKFWDRVKANVTKMAKQHA